MSPHAWRRAKTQAGGMCQLRPPLLPRSGVAADCRGHARQRRGGDSCVPHGRRSHREVRGGRASCHSCAWVSVTAAPARSCGALFLPFHADRWYWCGRGPSPPPPHPPRSAVSLAVGLAHRCGGGPSGRRRAVRWAQPDKRTAEAADDDDEEAREQLSGSGSAAAGGQAKYPEDAEKEFPLPSRDDSLLASPAGAEDAEETEPPHWLGWRCWPRTLRGRAALRLTAGPRSFSAKRERASAIGGRRLNP